jgi:hypothetical protein
MRFSKNCSGVSGGDLPGTKVRVWGCGNLCKLFWMYDLREFYASVAYLRFVKFCVYALSGIRFCERWIITWIILAYK